MIKNESQMEEEDLPLLINVFNLEKWRYCNLILYIIMSAFCDLQFFSFSILTTQLAQIYAVPQSLIFFWYNSAFILSSMVFAFPAGLIGTKFSQKCSLGLAVGLTTLGTWLKVLINYSFYYSLVGEYIVALAYSLFRVNVTKMTGQWFSPATRTFASSVLALLSFSLAVFSPFLTTLAINQEHISISQEHHYKDKLYTFSVIFACLTSLGGIVSWLFYRNEPEGVPSYSSSLDRLSIKQSLARLASNPSGVLIIISLGLAVSANIAYEGTVEAAFRKYGAQTLSLRWYSVASFPLLIILTPIIAYFAGKYGVYKLIFNLGNFLFLACYTTLLLFYTKGGSTLFGLVFILTCVPYCNIACVGIEFVTQVLFPIPEPVAVSLLYLSMKLCSLVLVKVASILIQSNYIATMLLLFLLIQLISTIMLLAAQARLNRRSLDFHESPRSSQSEDNN